MGDVSEDEDSRDFGENFPENSAQVLTESEIIETLISSGHVKLEDLVPKNFVISSENATKVALWILSNCERKSRLALSRLTWLTGIVHYGLIEDLSGLQKLYSSFMKLLKINATHKRACHLLFHLTTSSVFKWQVERIIQLESAVGRTKPLMGLLGRLKELRPDLVPYNVPVQSIQMAFAGFGNKFSRVLAERSASLNLRNSFGAVIVDTNLRHRKAKRRKSDLVPKPEFINLQSAVEVDLSKVKLVTSYQSPEWLAKNIFQLTLPNQISSLLFTKELHPVLALHYKGVRARSLNQWVYITLVHEFLEKPQYSDLDMKELILKQILSFQRTLGIHLNVVHIFLAEYLNVWDGNLLYSYILDLLRYVQFSSFEDLHDCFLSTIEQLYHQKDAAFRNEVVSLCVDMIENFIVERFGKPKNTKKLFVFDGKLSDDVMNDTVEALDVILDLIKFTQRLCNAGLTSSTKINELLTALQFHIKLAAIEEKYGLPFVTFCQPTVVYLAICSPSPVPLALICGLLTTYRAKATRVFDMVVPPFLDEFRTATLMEFSLFEQYATDATTMLFTQESLPANTPSFIVSRAPQLAVDKLWLGNRSSNPFFLSNHPAAAVVFARRTRTSNEETRDLKTGNSRMLTPLLTEYASIRQFCSANMSD